MTTTSSQVVREAVDFVLDHQPQPMHLVIATRGDPPLPIARLRARGHPNALHLVDPRFKSLGKPPSYSFGRMVRSLPSGQTDLLTDRTDLALVDKDGDI